MPAYLFIKTRITDPGQYQKYVEAVRPLAARHGSRYVVRSRPVEVLEGPRLDVVASRSDSENRYHRVSQFLASTVMRDGQAVLARNVMEDSQFGGKDSKDEILATSVICAPIRLGGEILGVIHLYSTDPDRTIDPDDLEFTLAVADTVAVGLANVHQREELAENLNLVVDGGWITKEKLCEKAASGPSPAAFCS